jgi:glycosyltransferase involved in cell wall biosynthesis
MIETLGLSHSISIEGYIEKPEGYLQRAKIILMPSRSEGLSTAMLEAMACGCVPVVSNVGCMNEAAIQAETALIVNNYLDIESYTASVLLLLRDSSMLASLSRKASVFVRERYCIEAQARVFTKIITELEDRKR